MLHISIFLAAFWAVLVLALDAPIPGYTVVPLTWDVDIFNNGTLYNLTGTIEQVYDQVEKIDPDFPLPSARTPSNFISTTDSSSAAAAGDWSTRCGPGTLGWERASRDPIFNGIQYLRGVSGRPGAGPGPGACGRVSCSWQSAIWWCNDNKRDFTLPSFGTIADCAQGLYDKCSLFEDRGEYVLGQNFHRDHWNCIVRRDRDSC